MADIRIEDLPQADFQRPQDVMAIQRLVAGVPTDYRMTFAVATGDVQIAIVEWDLATPISQAVITPGVDELAIYLTSVLQYTPTGSPTGAAINITIDQVSNALVFIDFIADAEGGAIHGRDESLVNTLDDVISVTQSGAAATGSARLTIQYLIVRL